jgi:hypothetical protein
MRSSTTEHTPIQHLHRLGARVDPMSLEALQLEQPDQNQPDAWIVLHDQDPFG